MTNALKDLLTIEPSATGEAHDEILPNFMRSAWSLMTLGQKLELLESDSAQIFAGTLARDELLEEMRATVETMERVLVDNGFEVMECEDGYFCVSEDFSGMTVLKREDAINDAYLFVIRLGTT